MPETVKKSNPKKKKLIIAIAVALAIVIIMGIAVIIIDMIENGKVYIPEPIDYDFYEADFSEDIYTDSEYVALIEGDEVSYLDMDTNLTIGISEKNVMDFGDDVVFFWNYIQNIIAGDTDAYNAMFSDGYYSKMSPKSAFTMQKLYDIKISKYASEVVEDSDGNYTKYTYIIEYKIFKNNGTFRNDIGDGSRKQYITITDKSGDFLIDVVEYVR